MAGWCVLVLIEPDSIGQIHGESDVSKQKRHENHPDWTQLLHAPAAANVSLQGTLKMNLAQAILDGHIPEGARLPSTRFLAKLLGVARITVGLAYEALEDQGLIVARKRSGHYVADGVRDNSAVAKPDEAGPGAAPVWSFYFSPTQDIPGNKLASSRQKYRYSFVGGDVDRSVFPFAEWRECSRLAQSTQGSEYWVKDLAEGDDPFLLDQIRERVLPRRGITAEPNEILITMGSQMALYLLAEVLIQPNTTVAFEDPGRPEARHLFLRRGGRLLPLPVDALGAELPVEISPHSTIYVTPGHQEPTGIALTLQRRQELLSLAHRHQSLIVEDDVEPEMHFGEAADPALRAMDRSGHVIYTDSFSSTLAPGLRLGYIVAHPALIERLRQLRSLVLRHPPGNNQRALALFIAHGHYERYLKRRRVALKLRAEQITTSLRHHLPEWEFRTPEGGSSIWLQSRPDEDVNTIKLRARKEGVLFESGDAYFHTSSPRSSFARLNYSTIDLDLIDPGIAALALAASKTPKSSSRDAFSPKTFSATSSKAQVAPHSAS